MNHLRGNVTSLLQSRHKRVLLVLSFVLLAIPWLRPAVRCLVRQENAAIASITRALVPDWYKADMF